MKTGLVLFLMFFVTVFSISAEQQAAIDRLKVKGAKIRGAGG